MKRILFALLLTLGLGVALCAPTEAYAGEVADEPGVEVDAVDVAAGVATDPVDDPVVDPVADQSDDPVIDPPVGDVADPVIGNETEDPVVDPANPMDPTDPVDPVDNPPAIEDDPNQDFIDSFNWVSIVADEDVLSQLASGVFDSFEKFEKGYYTGTDAFRGIDVSEHQGLIDWAAVKASNLVDFVIIRCGYGDDEASQDDLYWSQNVAGCRAQGIPFGVYLYSYALSNSQATSEANHALRKLEEAGLTPADLVLPVYLDMEDKSTANLSKSTLASIATIFCNRMINAGYLPGVYANLSWWTTKLTDPCFDNWYKWVAEWNDSIGLTYEGMKDFENCGGVWQFSDAGIIPGISGVVDLNYSYMRVNDLSKAIVTLIPTGPYDYTGTEVIPEFQVVLDGKVLEQDVDYTATFSNNILPGIATLLIRAKVGGTCFGSITKSFAIKIPGRTIGDGIYSITTSKEEYKVIDIAGGSTESGANAQLYTWNETIAQRYEFIYDSVTNTYRIVNKKSGLVLTLDKAEKGANLFQAAYSASNNLQKWYVAPMLDGSYVLVSYTGSFVMDIAGGLTDRGTNIQGYTFNNSPAQKWILTKLIDLSNAVVTFDQDEYTCTGSAVKPTVTVTVDGQLLTEGQDYTVTYTDNVLPGTGKVTIASKYGSACVESIAKTFAIRMLVPDALTEGTYSIISSKTENMVLDIANGSTESGANVQLYGWNGTIAQWYDFIYDAAAGAYKIVNCKSGLVLTLEEVAKRGNVCQATDKGTSNQRWFVMESTDGTYVLVNAAGPYVIDLANGSVEKRTNAQGYTFNDSAAQKWILNPLHRLIDAQVVFDQDEYSYNGSAITPAITVILDGKTLVEGQDYSVSISDNILPGSGKAVITALLGGDCVDAITTAFSIVLDDPQTLVDDIYGIFSSKDTGKVLDIADGSTASGANVQLYSWNESQAQRYQFTFDTATGTYIITNCKSGLALTLDGLAKRDNIYQATYSASNPLQRWYVLPTGDGSGTFILVSAAGPMVADLDNGSVEKRTNVQGYIYNGSAAQKWFLTRLRDLADAVVTLVDGTTYSYQASGVRPAVQVTIGDEVLVEGKDYTLSYTNNQLPGTNASVTVNNITGGGCIGAVTKFFSIVLDNPQTLVDDIYGIFSSKDTSKVLDIANGSTDPGANVQLYTWNESQAQRYQFTFDTATGTYIITNCKSGLALTLDGLAKRDNIYQAAYDPFNPLQRWYVLPVDDTYVLVSAAGSMVADLANGSVEKRTNAQGYVYNGSAAQKWFLTRLRDLADAVVTLVDGTDYAYDHNSVKPTVQVTIGDEVLVEGKDYTLTYTNNLLPGSNASVTVNNKPGGGCIGSVTKAFSIYLPWAATIEDGMYNIISSLSSNAAADVASGSFSSGANIQIYNVNGTFSQGFRFTYDSTTNTYTITNVGTDKALAFNGTANNANLIQITPDSSSLLQRWYVLPVSKTLNTQNTRSAADYYILVSAASPRLVVDLTSSKTTNGNNIQGYTWAGVGAQKWDLIWLDPIDISTLDMSATSVAYTGSAVIPSTIVIDGKTLTRNADYIINSVSNNVNIGTANISITGRGLYEGTLDGTFDIILADGIYRLRLASNTGLSIDIANGSYDPKANVRLWTANSSAAQMFVLTNVGGRNYSIVCYKNTLALDCANGGKTDGTNVWQYTNNGSAAQQWELIPNDDGTFALRSVSSGLYLGTASASAGKGTNLAIYSEEGGQPQDFRITAVPYSEYRLSGYYIEVDRTTCVLKVFRYTPAGDQVLYKSWLVSTGRNYATPSGDFYVGGKGYSFGDSDHTCYWYTQIFGDYLFHSVLYYPGTFTIKDGRLGIRCSGGCVRMSIENAKWIYDNIPSGTHVHIY